MEYNTKIENLNNLLMLKDWLQETKKCYLRTVITKTDYKLTNLKDGLKLVGLLSLNSKKIRRYGVAFYSINIHKLCDCAVTPSKKINVLDTDHVKRYIQQHRTDGYKYYSNPKQKRQDRSCIDHRFPGWESLLLQTSVYTK